MTTPLRIGIAGAMGRMGQAVAAAVEAQPHAQIAARFDRPELAVSGYVSRDEAIDASDVIIDFTRPDATVALARAAAAKGVALVIGSTGLLAEDEAAVAEAAKSVAVVRTGNFSLGVNVLVGLVRQAAAMLDPQDWDVEIFEAHHRRKIDAPSGTALMMGRAAAEGRGVELDAVSERGRDGITGPRAEGAIGFSVMRGGGIVGEHSVAFVAEDEILTIGHSARDRSLFARGAVRAALWTRDRAPGLYDMQDVLGFRGS